MTRQNSYIKVSVGPSRQKKEEDLGFKDIFLGIAACLLIFGIFAVVGQIATYGLERVLTYKPTKAYTLDFFKGN